MEKKVKRHIHIFRTDNIDRKRRPGAPVARHNLDARHCRPVNHDGDTRKHGIQCDFSDTATVNNVNSLKKHFSTSPGVSGIIYFSPEDALQKWQEETGEDLVKVLGINPLPGELEVKVKARYASTDSINSMIAPLKSCPM